MPAEKFNVLGVAVSAMTLDIAVQEIIKAAAGKQKGYICVTGVHGIMEAQRNSDFRKILNRAFLNTTDGMPLVWLGRKAKGGWVDRVYGPDLMLALFKATEGTSFKHFLYGGAPGVADRLKNSIQARFPGANFVGTYCPPFRPLNRVEEGELASQIQEVKPDLVWVGLSTPKQERFMAEYLPRLETTLMAGVGAAFDFHSGTVRQAPYWMQRSGTEWLFRLCSEPRRLGHRYLVNNPSFLWLIAGQILGRRKYPLEAEPLL